MLVSEPIISFRETILPVEDTSAGQSGISLPPPWSEISGLSKAKLGQVSFTNDVNNLTIGISCHALPGAGLPALDQDPTTTNNFVEFLSNAYANSSLSSEQLRASIQEYLTKHAGAGRLLSDFHQTIYHPTDHQQTQNQQYHSNHQNHNYDRFAERLQLPEMNAFTEAILSIGPKHSPTNLLTLSAHTVIEVFTTSPESTLSRIPVATLHYCDSTQRDLFLRVFRRLYTGLCAGFQAAVGQGPLMHETVYGVAFMVDKLEIAQSVVETILTAEELTTLSPSYTTSASSSSSPNTNLSVGQLISEMKDHCKLALLSSPLRVVEPIYQCDLQCDQSQLGNLYAVLSRRRGEVFQEDIIDGTTLFLLSAYLPVVNSFQFAQELLKKTSGNGTAPQLSFSHWRVLEQDPFWRPTTEEELEEFGEQFNEEHNLARNWINRIRKRKGLQVDQQVVVSAEKQRTLKK